MTAIRQIDPIHTRRLIISKQHLDADERPPMLDLIRDLGCLQLDPIRKVERTHSLVLWSRLGNYDRKTLHNLRWTDTALFEYWAHAASLVLTEDYPLHAVYMRQMHASPKLHAWLDHHDLHTLRQHVLTSLAEQGAMGTKDFIAEGHEQNTGETFHGWSSGRAINRLMQRMWTMGDVLPAARQGNQRRWHLTEKVLPQWTPRTDLTPYQASRQAVQRAVKALGVAMDKKHINYHFTRGRYWHFKQVKADLLAEGILIPVQIADWSGDWLLHVDDLPKLEQIERGEWQGRTTLLSPFDNLICDRDRTEHLWDFRFRIEIYVPPAKRQYGYYVLPILHHDRLIGRMDMAMDRKRATLEVIATYAQADAPGAAAPDIRDALQNLATFLGADTITYGETLPSIWQSLRQ